MNHRTHTLRVLAGSILLVFALVASAAFAGQVALTFDSVPAAACYDFWTDQICDLQIVNTLPGDCLPPSCAFTLRPGEMEISAAVGGAISATSHITRIEADIVEGATAGCAKLKIRSGAFPIGQTESTHAGPAPETLVLQAPTGFEISSFTLSGDATTVREIRLISDGVPVSLDRWGAIKARFE